MIRLSQVLGFIILLFILNGCDTSITKYQDPNKLSHEEILANLRSGDFQKVLTARSQISRLDPKERLSILKTLLTEPKPELRMIAITELEKLKPASCKLLLDAASKDKDPDVRNQAQEASQGCLNTQVQDQQPPRPQPPQDQQIHQK